MYNVQYFFRINLTISMYSHLYYLSTNYKCIYNFFNKFINSCYLSQASMRAILLLIWINSCFFKFKKRISVSCQYVLGNPGETGSSDNECRLQSGEMFLKFTCIPFSLLYISFASLLTYGNNFGNWQTNSIPHL